MARIACRFPGGMNLHINRGALPPQVIKVQGPAGKAGPTVTNAALKPPSRYAATSLQKNVVDTVKALKDSSEREFNPSDYGVTFVDDSFWQEFVKQNANFDVITHKLVFAL